MELGMSGSGSMGSSMVRRLLRAGHSWAGYDLNPQAGPALVVDGAVRVLPAPRFQFGGHEEQAADSKAGA